MRSTFPVITMVMVVTLLGLPSAARAQYDKNNAPMTLHGTLIEPPPCTINGGETTVVDFGTVGTSRVDGNNYKRLVNYAIVCEDDPDNHPWLLGLSVIGAATSFDDAAVQAKVSGSASTDLGIRMLLGGKAFTLNKRVDISQGPQPILQVVPVQRPGATLPEGDFNATATLLADYE
jgi:type 1 fimbria pilin